MTAEKVRRAFCLTLPFCLTMAEKVRQVAKVRQYRCLTFYACSTPINKGDGEIVRQLGRLGKTFQNLALEGWGSRSLPNLPNRLTRRKRSEQPNRPPRPARTPPDTIRTPAP